MLLLVIFIFLVLIMITTKLKLVVKITDNQKEITLKIYILFVLYIFNINLNKKRSLKGNSKIKKKIDNITKSKKSILKILYKAIKQFKMKVEKLKFNIDISTSDTVLTAYSVAFIASAISLFIKHINLDVDLKEFNYRVKPIYTNTPKFKLDIYCIISTNLVHIIYIFIRNFKKWRSDFYGRTTSNRRPYGNCNE